MRRPALGCLVVGALSMANMLSIPLPSEAGSGRAETLPAFNGQKVKNGVIAKLDCRWTDGYGYRPVRVTLTVRKTNRDRTIRVVLLPESYARGLRDPLSVTSDIEIPEGEKSVTQTIFVPQQIPWRCFRARFYENGRMLEDLSMTKTEIEWGGGRHSGDAPCILIVDRQAPRMDDNREQIIIKLEQQISNHLPDVNKLQFLTNQHYQMNARFNEVSLQEASQLSDDRILTRVQNTPTLELLPPSDLPTTYVGLTGIDLMVISLEDLSAISSSDSQRFQAIDYFVRNGGNLFVYSANETAAELSNLLGQAHEWKKADMRLFRNAVLSSYDELLEENEVKQGRPKIKPPEDAPAFQNTTHGLGILVAIDSPDPYRETIAYWQWVVRSIGLNRLTWSNRHGVTLVGSNNDYWDFMIPGYGASPVGAFLGVITLFILCIGPLNFFVLNKAKRLYLLPLTVAVAAMVTTITMMGYAMVSDGLATHARLRSFTLLDQTGQQRVASTHSRQSYLAAFVPSNGLVFPEHTCVYPVLPHFENSLEREETVEDENRILTRGYIRPRSTTQFLTTDVRQVEHGIGVQLDTDGSLTSAKNLIGVLLTHVWIRDGQGKLHQARNVSVDGQIELQRANEQDALKRFTQAIVENKPVPPEGMDQASNATYGFVRYNRYRSRPVFTETSLLNSQMVESADFFNTPKPQTYLVLTQATPPFVHRGIQAEEVAGFHVIRGKW